MTERSNSTRASTLQYLAFPRAQTLSALLFLAVGILSLIFYDYGLISFLFAFPQFFLTGFIPLMVGLLILIRNLTEAEEVKLSAENGALHIDVQRKIKSKTFPPLTIDHSKIKYLALKYRETRTKRWFIIFILLIITIEVHFQNAVHLYPHARIAPLLIIWTIMMSIGIIIFTFTPRRFIEIADDKETFFLPFTSLKEEQKKVLFTILNLDDVNSSRLRNRSIISTIVDNILKFPLQFFLGMILLYLGVLLLVDARLYLGSFTRVLVIIYAMKLLLRTFNGEPFFFFFNPSKAIYRGLSIKLTFINAFDAPETEKESISPLRYHIFEILVIWYLLFQSLYYGFKHLWWDFAQFNLLYLYLGILLIALLFLRWFNPTVMDYINFGELQLEIRKPSPLSFSKQIGEIFKKFKTIRDNDEVLISTLLFLLFILSSILYILYGGNFLLI